jgi:hypothetical protein
LLPLALVKNSRKKFATSFWPAAVAQLVGQSTHDPKFKCSNQYVTSEPSGNSTKRKTLVGHLASCPAAATSW